MEQQFLTARDLIKAKRYPEARQLLQTINHPKAREWLATLDQIAPEAQSSSLIRDTIQPSIPTPSLIGTVRPQPKPQSNPPALVNDNKPKRVTVDLEAILSEAKELVRRKQLNQAKAMLNGLEHPAALHLMAIITDIEQDLEMKSRRNTKNIIIGILIILVVGGLGTMLYFAMRDRISDVVTEVVKPQVYEDNLVRIDYSLPWISIDRFMDGTCYDVDFCKLTLQNTANPHVAFLVGWGNLDYFASVDEIRFVIENAAPGKVLWLEQITFSNVPATEFATLAEINGRNWYMDWIIYTWGPYFITIEMVASSEEEFEQYRTAFDYLLNSLEMKTG